MRISRLFRRLAYLIVLLFLGGTQSACSLFDVYSGAEQQKPESRLTFTGFRYEIPSPNYPTPVIVTETRVQASSEVEKAAMGFKLQSFVEKIFLGGGKSPVDQSQADPAKATRDVASIKLPDTDRPTATVKKLKSNFCARINNRLSSIDYHECMSIRLEPTGHVSAQGDPIMISRFRQLGGTVPTGRVLLIGGVHGDELSSVSIVFE
ncbi:MAG: murein peptide amidase A, partial [Desulfobacterales bacterium]|nr:murein peptide amidase A [Desulfobacterales bacterium]